MSHQKPHVAGAEAPQREDPDLQDVVSNLVRLSVQEKDNLASCSLSSCNEMLRELSDYANNPAGKPERTIAEVIGQMFLLSQRKAQLQLTESQEQIAQLQRSYQPMQTSNFKLHQEVISTQADLAQAKGDTESLLSQIQSLLEKVTRAAMSPKMVR